MKKLQKFGLYSLLAAALSGFAAAAAVPSFTMTIGGTINPTSNQIISNQTVIDETQGYLYSGAINSAGGSAQAEVIKIHLPSFTTTATLPLPGITVPPSAAIIDSSHGMAYFAFSDPTHAHPARIVKIDLASFQVVSTLPLTSSETQLSCGFIDVVHGFAYFGSTASPEIVKIDLSTFHLAGTLALGVLDGQPMSAVLDPSNGVGFFVMTQPEQVLRIDLNQLQVVNRFSAPIGTTLASGAVVDATLGYAYFGMLAPGPGGISMKALRIALQSPTGFIGSYRELWNEFGQQPAINSILIDPVNHLAYYGIEASLPRIVELRLTDFSVVQQLPLAMGQEASLAGPYGADLYMSKSFGSGGGVTQVHLLPAPPSISLLNPPQATAGDPALTVKVIGSNFVQGATVTWNGAHRPTTYVADNELDVQLSPADLVAAQDAQQVVINPDGQSSGAFIFKVYPVANLPGHSVGYVSNATLSGINSQRSVARGSDGRLHVVYSGQLNIYYSYSDDNGSTWTQEKVNPLYIPFGIGMQFQPSLAVDSKNNVHVVWYGNSWGTDKSAITIEYRQRTSSGWLPQEHITDQSSAFDQGSPAIAVDSSDNVSVVWAGKGWGTQPGRFNIQYRKRTGSNWLSQESVTDIASDQGTPSLAIDAADNVHVAWIGAGWGAQPLNANVQYRERTLQGWQNRESVTDLQNVDQTGASIALDSGDNPLVAWSGGDAIHSFNVITLRKRLATGWQTPELLTDGSQMSSMPSVAVDASDNIHVAWVGAYPKVQNIHQRSKISGNWQAEESLTNSGEVQDEPNLLWSAQPVIAGARPNVAASGYSLLWHAGVSAQSTLRYYSTATWVPSHVITSTAVYDPILKVPMCGSIVNACDSGTLLVGRDTIAGGPEPNQPNTLYSQCKDATVGTFHVNESIDRLTVSTLDGSPMTPGKDVRIDADYWANFVFLDFVHFFYTTNLSSPTWTYLQTVSPARIGSQVLSTTFTLPTANLVAVRAFASAYQDPTNCQGFGGNFADIDDLAFIIRLDSSSPSSPLSPIFVSASTNSLTLSWNTATDDTGVMGYKVDLALDPNFTQMAAPYTNYDATNVTSVVLKGLTDGTTYYARVQAYDLSLNLSRPSTTAQGVTVLDRQAPTVSFLSPANGATISGVIAISGTASDNMGVAKIVIEADGRPIGTAQGTTSWIFSVDSRLLANGTQSLVARAFDVWGNQNTASISVQIVNQGQAGYDPVRKAPLCPTVSPHCDSGPLLVGRESIPGGPEPHEPNTLFNSCADGSGGTFHVDASMDHVRIRTLDGSNLAPGKQVRIEADVWTKYSSGFTNTVDFYSAANADNPVWIKVGTQFMGDVGAQVAVSTFTLPAGQVQAIRTVFYDNFRTQAPCPSSFDSEADDLVFTTQAPGTMSDSVPPLVAITNPTNGVQVSGTIAFSGTASDDQTLSQVAIVVDGIEQDVAIGTQAWVSSWDSHRVANGPHTVEARATDGAGNTATAQIQITVLNADVAAYDSALKAPLCAAISPACDSGILLNSRDSIGGKGELHQPNTLQNSCRDGSSGNYHSDESNDRLRISTLDGSSFAPGKVVKIEATVWSAGSSFDTLDLYYAADARAPHWVYITSLVPPYQAQVLSTTYTLPTGDLQAVRASLREFGTETPCSGGVFDDADDIAFAVQSTAGSTAPSIATLNLPSGTVGLPYSTQLQAVGGIGPYAWSISAGSLPLGLSISTTGDISGTPTTSGTSMITVQAQDSLNASTTASFNLTVNTPIHVDISPGLAALLANQTQRFTATVIGSANTAVTWSISPASGTVDVNGLYTAPAGIAMAQVVTIRATSVADPTKSATSPITLLSSLVITSTGLPSAMAGQPYSASLQAAGGTAPYTWTSSAGLPPGITMDTAGVLSGIPTAGGTVYSFAVTVQDGIGVSTSAFFNITVLSSATISVTPASLGFIQYPGGPASSSATVTVQSANPSIGLIVNILPTGNCAWLQVLGQSSFKTPITMSYQADATSLNLPVGTYTCTVNFSIPGTIIPVPITLTVPAIPPLVITSTFVPQAILGQPYSATLVAVGGVPPYQWAFGSSPQVPGLLISTAGVLTGTPAVAGTFMFEAEVFDYGFEQIVKKAFAIVVNSSQTTASPVVPVIQGFDPPLPSMVDRATTLHLNILGQWTEIEWTFTSTEGNPALGWPAQTQGRAQASGTSYTATTQAASLPLSGLPLILGPQHLMVIVRNGSSSASMSADFTLVSSNLSSVKVHPSPWRSDLHSGHDITFDNLPVGSTVKIFTISGRWVKTLSNASGQATWDLKNDDGRMAASGIYLYLITDSAGDKAHGKFGIIR